MILIIIMDSDSRTKNRIKQQFRKCISEVKFIMWDDKELIKKIKTLKPLGIILTGSGERILGKDVPSVPKDIFELGIPILGICYGYETIIKHFVGKNGIRAYDDLFDKPNKITIEYPFTVGELTYQLSHHDDVVKIPSGWKEIKQTGFIKHNKDDIAGCYDPKRKILGIIFHPEKRTKTGKQFFDAWIKLIQI